MGLPNGQRRPTSGLRREEVAELAGIGVDWYTRLEQGRAITPSATTLDALSRALRLSKAERIHLRALARKSERPAFSRETVSDVVLRVVQNLNQPAYITGRRWDILAWNAAAAELFTDFECLPQPDRNILIYMLAYPGARQLFGAGWADEAKRMLAQFRATYDLWAGDPAFLELIRRLQDASPEFVYWWGKHEIRTGAVGQKNLAHPSKGLLHFEYATFQSNDDPALKLAIYTPMHL